MLVLPSFTRKAVAPASWRVSGRPPGPKEPKAAPRPEFREAVPENVRELTMVSTESVCADETPAF